VVIDNRATEIGDVIIVKGNVPLQGVVSLISFTDTLVGETASRFFIKTFRFAVDGINFTTLQPLTNPNLVAININPLQFFLIELRYERGGTDISGELEFIENILSGTFIPIVCGEIYQQSVFFEFFNCCDASVSNWCINVLEKLYRPGIIPKFVTRGIENNANNEDQDYIDFWRTVACFMSLFVNLARVFQNFQTEKVLIDEYLIQKGLFICETDSLVEHQFLMENFYAEITKRATTEMNVAKLDKRQIRTITLTGTSGTANVTVGGTDFLATFNTDLGTTASDFITSHAADILAQQEVVVTANGDDLILTADIADLLFTLAITNVSGDLAGTIVNTQENEFIPVNGEMLRLICFGLCDEYLFTLTDPQKLGWNVGNSSPLYKGTNFQDQIIKGYEGTKDFVDLTKYPLINASKIAIVTDIVDTSREVMEIDIVGAGDEAGIGVDLPFTGDEGFLIVDPGLDYEITFLVRQPTLDDVLTFKCFGFDSSNNQIDLQSILDGLDDNIFFEEVTLNKDDTFYLVRGIIYGKDHNFLTVSGALLNIGYGNNLRFPSDKVCKIIPRVTLDNTSGGGASTNMRIHDFKVRPLLTDYSTGFIQTPNFIQIWLKNNNLKFSSIDIEEIIRKFMIPYNSTLKINFLGDIDGVETQKFLFNTVSDNLTTFDPEIFQLGPDADWDLGDGNTVTANNSVSHTYADGSQKLVELIVDDFSIITEIDFQSDDLVGLLELDLLTNIGKIVANTNSLLTGVIFPIDATPIIEINFKDCNIKPNVNLTPFINLAGIIRFDGNALLQTVTFPISNKIITDLRFNGCNLSSIDFTNLSKLSGNIELQSQSLLAIIILPASGEVFTKIKADFTIISFIDFTILIADNSGIIINMNDTTMSVADVNHVLVDLDATGWTGGTLTTDGNTAPPDAVSGGFDGLTAKSNLTGKGWTVTTD